jgi:enoyl-CoA hydratase/carnithine racemase
VTDEATIDKVEVGPLVQSERLADPSAIVLTLNRSSDRNPLDMSTLVELRQHLEDIISDASIRAIIITGAGSAFSAGGDLKAYVDLYSKPSEFRLFLDTFGQVCWMLESCAAISIAMINGACVAGGLELALSCDLITMSETARIGDGHVRFAQLPGAGGSQRLVRAIGVQRAKYWLITGRLVSAAEAAECGLVSVVAPPDALREATLDLARSVERMSSLALGQMKQLISAANRSDLEEGLSRERDIVFRYATTSADAQEGLRAFGEGRPGLYMGR